MPPLAQLITDRFLGQQVNLLRLSASERNKVFTMLGTLQARVLAKMDTQIPLPGFATFSQARLAALYRTTDKLMDQAYGAISTLHDTTLIDVSEFQSRQSRKIVNALVGVPLMTVGLPLVNMKALVNDDLVDGRPAAYWWNQQTDTLKAEYRNVIRQGAFAGDTLGQMKQRVQGTKAQNYQNGIMARVGKRAETLIRTSILSVANAARDATFRANDDVLDGQQWHSSLDDRTCEICAALDGQAWDFEGNKMDGTTQDFPGPPPAHFNCRCTTTPVLKSLAQMQRDAGEDDTLGRKLDNIEGDMSPGMRASLEGGVASTTTYDGWLKNQDVATQKDILGPKRYDLFQQGKINVQDLVDQQNRALTLDQIKARIDSAVHETAVPEWAPAMSYADAAAWSKNSVLSNESYYHYTTTDAAKESILAQGYNDSNGIYGKGIYLTADAETVGQNLEGRTIRLPVMTNMTNIETVQGFNGMVALAKRYGVKDPSELYAKNGTHGVKIEFPNSPPWLLVFDKTALTTVV